MELSFQRAGILGVGLIGGSLGLAIKKVAPHIRILGLGRDAERLRRACQMGAIDDFELGNRGSLGRCDLVILATPVEHILCSLDTLGDCLAPGAVVTDAGSTKRRICRLAWDRLPPTVEFIGGHPIAGREVTGVESSLAHLFQDAPYVLCPKPDSPSFNLQRLKCLVEIIGARPVIMTPEEHDRTIARVSHLPQLLSTSLANMMGSKDLEISGSGLREMLRLSGSSYSVWRGIFETNADNISSAVEDFILLLQKAREALNDGGLSGEFERAGDLYRRLKASRS